MFAGQRVQFLFNGFSERLRQVIRSGRLVMPYYSPRGQEAIPSSISSNPTYSPTHTIDTFTQRRFHRMPPLALTSLVTPTPERTMAPPVVAKAAVASAPTKPRGGVYCHAVRWSRGASPSGCWATRPAWL